MGCIFSSNAMEGNMVTIEGKYEVEDDGGGDIVVDKKIIENYCELIVVCYPEKSNIKNYISNFVLYLENIEEILEEDLLNINNNLLKIEQNFRNEEEECKCIEDSFRTMITNISHKKPLIIQHIYDLSCIIQKYEMSGEMSKEMENILSIVEDCKDNIKLIDSKYLYLIETLCEIYKCIDLQYNAIDLNNKLIRESMIKYLE